MEGMEGARDDVPTPASAATFEEKDLESLEQHLKKRSPIFSLFNNDTVRLASQSLRL